MYKNRLTFSKWGCIKRHIMRNDKESNRKSAQRGEKVVPNTVLLALLNDADYRPVYSSEGVIVYEGPHPRHKVKGMTIPRYYAFTPWEKDYWIVGWPQTTRAIKNGEIGNQDFMQMAIDNCLGRRAYMETIPDPNVYLERVQGKLKDSLSYQAGTNIEPND